MRVGTRWVRLGLLIGVLSCDARGVAAPAPPSLSSLRRAPVAGDSLSLLVGDSVMLVASDRVRRTRFVRWSSSDVRVATVGVTGWVHAAETGESVVSATGLAASESWVVLVSRVVLPPIDTATPIPPDTTSPPAPADTGATPPFGPLGLNADLGRRLFPDDNPWNQPIDTAAVDPNSDAIIALIGGTRRLHPDFGAFWNGGPFGIPYVVVSGTQPRVPISFYYPSESDPGPYPIPPDPPIEGGPTSTGDRHILVVDRDAWRLWEVFDAYPNGDGSWRAGSGAVFDLNSNALRPAGWTSADAAGLPILPGLVRYEEVAAGEIRHALRFTVSRSRRAYLHPARHWASSDTSSLRPPMGMRVRLKASVNISSYPRDAQVVLRALKTYGMIVADNGSDWFVSGTADARWNDAAMNTLKQLRGSDFEVVRMHGVVTR